jgi:hypothetical protein
MDPILFLSTYDTALRSFMQGIAREAEEYGRELDEERAIRIGNALGRVMSGG